jgi:hypothetical protein
VLPLNDFVFRQLIYLARDAIYLILMSLFSGTFNFPATVLSFIQRAGRAAWGTGQTGLAILLVEKLAYNLELIDELDQNNRVTKKEERPHM